MKQQLREHLLLHCQEQDVRKWFDPLSLTFDSQAQCITVAFPHAFFGTWFANGPQTTFIQAVYDCFDQHYTVHFGSAQSDNQPSAEQAKHVLMNSTTASSLQSAPTGHQGRKKHKTDTASAFDSAIVNNKNLFPRTATRADSEASLIRRSHSALVCGESGRERQLTHKNIIDIVSNHFNLTPTDILGNTRKQEIVFARQIAMFLCRELLGCSFPTLGRFFHGKDHSTTMYSVKKILKLQQDNKDTHTLVTKLKKLCINLGSDTQ